MSELKGASTLRCGKFRVSTDLSIFRSYQILVSKLYEFPKILVIRLGFYKGTPAPVLLFRVTPVTKVKVTTYRSTSDT